MSSAAAGSTASMGTYVVPSFDGPKVEPEAVATFTRPGIPRVSIVLATLNEVENVPTLLRQIRELDLPPIEIIVVDDGSVDGTRQYLVREAAIDRRIRLIFHEGRQTLVPAHCQGIDAAQGEFVIIMDADLQHPPQALPLLVRSLLDGAALAIASRYAKGGSPGERSAWRGMISRGAESTAKFLVPEARRVSDPTSGFYGFRRNVFVPLDPVMEGYELLPFLLVMCNGFPTREIPYQFAARQNGESKIVQKKFDFVRTFLSEMWAIRKWRRTVLARRARGKRPSSVRETLAMAVEPTSPADHLAPQEGR